MTPIKRRQSTRYLILKWHHRVGLILALFIFILANLSITDTKAQDEEQLAEAAQNPVGDLISIPFQNNTSFGIGPHSRTQNVLNIQPVYPFHVNEKWNLITRTIIPIISQPDVSMESGGNTGIGDISFTAFLSPKSPGKLIDPSATSFTQ